MEKIVGRVARCRRSAAYSRRLNTFHLRCLHISFANWIGHASSGNLARPPFLSSNPNSAMDCRKLSTDSCVERIRHSRINIFLWSWNLHKNSTHNIIRNHKNWANSLISENIWLSYPRNMTDTRVFNAAVDSWYILFTPPLWLGGEARKARNTSTSLPVTIMHCFWLLQRPVTPLSPWSVFAVRRPRVLYLLYDRGRKFWDPLSSFLLLEKVSISFFFGTVNELFLENTHAIIYLLQRLIIWPV